MFLINIYRYKYIVSIFLYNEIKLSLNVLVTFQSNVVFLLDFNRFINFVSSTKTFI